MHFFTEHDKLHAETAAYGPVVGSETTKYNVTSGFALTSPAKAFACQDSMMLVLQSEENSLVNVILKPNSGLSVDFPKIKYYIYRGLKKDNFINSSGEIIAADPSNSEFISKLWTNIGMTSSAGMTITPTLKDIGYESINIEVEKIFLNTDASIAKPIFIKEGTWIGNFVTSCGFEIIFDTDHLYITTEYMGKRSHNIDISGLQGATDAQKFILRCEREKILNYIDPAAFWGMHYSTGCNIYDAASANKKREIKGADLYTTFINKYSTKNRVYLDIRSEYGYSYNFYQNYADTTPGKSNLKYKTDKANPFLNHRYERDWPIFYSTGGLESRNYSSLIIQLRVDDNIKPLVFSEDHKILPKSKQKCFLSDKEILNGLSTEWTKDIELRFPNINDSAMVVYISNYLKIQYFRQFDNPVSPNTVLSHVLNPLSISKGLKLPNKELFSKLNHQPIEKRSFISEYQYSFVSENGVFNDGTNIILYSKNAFSYSKSKDYFPKIDFPKTPIKKIVNSSMLPKDILFNKWQVNDTTTTTVDIIEIVGYNKDSLSTNTEDIFYLGLTKTEYDILQNLAGISTLHSRLIIFKADPNPQVDAVNNIPYKKYSIEIFGLNNEGVSTTITPPSEIFVYGSGKGMLCSKDFAALFTIPSLLPDPGGFEEFRYVYRFDYDGNDVIVNSTFSKGIVKIDEFDNGIQYKSEVGIIGEIHFAIDKIGDSTISTKKSNYPLVVIIHGNGQRYSDYRNLAVHLAKNGFIVASISCLINKENNTAALLSIPTIPENFSVAYSTNYYLAHKDLDAYYVFTNDSTSVINSNYKFEKLTIIRGFWDNSVTPNKFNITSEDLLSWVKGTDFKIKTSSTGVPQEIEFLFKVGNHHMLPKGRSNVLYPHLKIIKNKFGNKVQNNISLIGHSRGGQAVLRAANNISSSSAPADLRTITSIISLAPTDFEHWRKDPKDDDLLKDIPYLVLYGSKDADVSGVKDTGFSLWDRAINNAEKSMAFVYGATHNGFITNNHDWTDKKDKIKYDPKVLLDDSLQKLICKSYFNAFLRMTLKGEKIWQKLFSGELKTPSISSANDQGIYIQYQDERPVRLIDDFQDSTKDWKLLSGIGVEKDLKSEATFPHNTKALILNWKANDELSYSPAAAININTLGFKYFSFRITKVVQKPSDLTELRISLNTYSLFVKDYYKIPNPDVRPDGLGKSALLTIRLPLSEYAINGLDVSSITKISFLFPNVGSGEVTIDSIEFTN